MLVTNSKGLHFSFPQVHKDAQFGISFQRTLRIPDDGALPSNCVLPNNSTGCPTILGGRA